MDMPTIEQKWQKRWEESGLYKFDKNSNKPKYYLLEMFSYPSGATLHLGHWYNYSLSDTFGRYKTLKGYNVFHPMGFDAFGLPAENYALKTGIHPRVSTEKNMEIMERQLSQIGATYDWDYKLATCKPEYYKWSQWLFTKLFEKGLAYQKYSPVNWCTSCQTVLANEQVVNGSCERCGSEVIRKNMTQWFFKITDYAERLLKDLDKLDWPEKTKVAQRNWIGKSVGAEIDFKTEKGHTITVFTSRPDTLFGVSWIVLAPEHELVLKLTTKENLDAVKEYIYQASKKDDVTRQSTTAPKTGVFTGSYAINPINNKKVPIYIADYVLSTYATGAVMGVAAHDERDYEFAIKYGLEIIKVIENEKEKTVLPYIHSGIMVNSGKYNGLKNEDAKDAIVKDLEAMNVGRFKVNYKLRDWSVSRQRYWGTPIPIIYDENGVPTAVPEKDLPVLLPESMDYKPDGQSPLAKNEKFVNTIHPITKKPAKRDTDTLDTFVCSSWYFLRYPSANRNDVPFDKEITNKMLPVDKYVGGMEHATGHLLYARFITKFLYDNGYIDFDEPFISLVHQGMILGSDGQKMSKSKGNTVNIDEYVKFYGSDALRLYLAFGFNYIEGGPWNDSGIKSMSKFIDRAERIILKAKNLESESTVYGNEEKELDYVRNYTIKEVERNLENFEFNCAVARIMELVNALYKYDQTGIKNVELFKNTINDLVILLSPFAPHFAEEMFEQLGHTHSVHKQTFPVYDESKLVKQEVEIAVQVNSKIITRMLVGTNMTEQEVVDLAVNNEKVANVLEGKKIVKQIYVQNSLINLIVK